MFFVKNRDRIAKITYIYWYSGKYARMAVLEIKKVVRFHRKKSGLSQAELGQLGGVGKTVVFDIEHGKMTVQLDTLLKVLKVLNIQIEFKGPLMKLFEESMNERG